MASGLVEAIMEVRLDPHETQGGVSGLLRHHPQSRITASFEANPVIHPNSSLR